MKQFIRQPNESDDKYSRGVLGFVTGTDEYPGAALLGITAAMRTGVGMVRYLGPEKVSTIVIEARPETVLQAGRAQAWVVGSGVPPNNLQQGDRIRKLAAEQTLLVVDAGALQIIDFEHCAARCVLTPHAGEAAELLNKLGHSVSRAEVEADPLKFALLIANTTKQLTVIKGSRTVLAEITQSGERRTYQFDAAPSVLATAGSGDVLAGIIGALLAGNADDIVSGAAEMFDVVKAAINLQAQAAALAAKDSTVVALDIAEAVGRLIANS